MKCATITITDNTKPAQSLYTLLSQGSQPGYTVSPAAGIALPLNLLAMVSYISIQASVQNSSSYIYVGDENVHNDGTQQGKELAAGIVSTISAYPLYANLNEIYVRANANSVKINVEIHTS
jgi:hypothetical protein